MQEHRALIHPGSLPLRVTCQDGAVTAIRYLPEDDDHSSAVSPLTEQVEAELAEYFSGARREFTFPIRLAGSPFQEKVWRALLTIPYGETRTYGQIAQQIGSPGAARAVGMANHCNPILIAVPCHRVIGAKGTLIGYAAGLELKQKLLKLEKTTSSKSQKG